MSTYSLIIEKEHIKVFKKKNKFKLDLNFKVEPNCDIIDKFKNDEIFKILRALNKDTIEYINIDNNNIDATNITLVLNNFENNDDYDNDDDDKYYLSFTKKILDIDDNKIIINGKRNSIELLKDKFKKLDLENINFNINIQDESLNLVIKITYNGETLPIYLENFVAKLFGKIFLKLIKYFGKKN